jgi:hypothetical protein
MECVASVQEHFQRILVTEGVSELTVKRLPVLEDLSPLALCNVVELPYDDACPLVAGRTMGVRASGEDAEKSNQLVDDLRLRKVVVAVVWMGFVVATQRALWEALDDHTGEILSGDHGEDARKVWVIGIDVFYHLGELIRSLGLFLEAVGKRCHDWCGLGKGESYEFVMM